MTTLNLALVGFGNVGKAFADLLIEKKDSLLRSHGITTRITGIATQHHGMVLDRDGIDMESVMRVLASEKHLGSLNREKTPASVMDFIRSVKADVLFENTPVNHHSGQPAIDHLKAGFECGMHGITANKGPVAHAYQELTKLAEKHGVRFLFESAVMDGAPIFSLFRGPLPVVEMSGFEGILNSCTNLLIELMENGKSFDEAVAYGRSIGITETDPSADIDGWDAAIKVSALATVLMGYPIKPDEVRRTGIRTLTSEMIQSALIEGERWKLVCTAKHTDAGLEATVEPRRVKATSPLYSINGTSSFVQFQMDCLPGLGILESNPGPRTTAYGLLADLINSQRGM